MMIDILSIVERVRLYRVGGAVPALQHVHQTQERLLEALFLLHQAVFRQHHEGVPQPDEVFASLFLGWVVDCLGKIE
jgi:hypothetical protein